MNALSPDRASYRGDLVHMILCTAGTRRLMLNDKIFNIVPGVCCIVSPVIFACEIQRSADYADIIISGELEVFFPIMTQYIDIIIGMRLRETPCLTLPPQSAALFKERHATIKRKLQYADTITDTNERRMLMHIIATLRQLTLLEIVHLYYKHLEVKSEPQNTTAAGDTIARFLTLLNEHYSSERKVSFYASACNLSPNHFTRLVKSQTGFTPSELITLRTVVHAKMLLSHSQLSIKEIAAELHFPEQFTFRKFFKHYTGVSPRDYRASLRR